MSTPQQRQQVADICSSLTLQQMSPEAAAYYYHQTGNPYIVFAFQSQVVQAGLITDQQFTDRFEHWLKLCKRSAS